MTPPLSRNSESATPLHVYKRQGRVVEVEWKDADGCSGRFIDNEQVRVEQDAPDDAAAMLHVGAPPKDGTIWANPVYLTAEQAIELGLALLESAQQWQAEQHPLDGPENRMTEDQRWRAHVAACGLQDMTFWVHKDPRWPNHYCAVEVETGVAAWGDTEEEAMRNYFAGKHERPHEPVEP